jgi:hypothetical protein
MSITKIRRVLILSAIVMNIFAMSANAKTVKDTPVPSDHQCDFVNFHHNEAKNAKGPGKCESDCDCDGMRSCVEGSCSGKARPVKLTAETCNTKDYHYQEAWTKAGPGKCEGDCECDGLRTCVSGECTGTAR